MSAGWSESIVDAPMGETLSMVERLIVAPSCGKLCLDGRLSLKSGDPVYRGDVIGAVHSLGIVTPIQSPFGGVLVEVLAVEGERLRTGQPVAWLRVVRPTSRTT
jgi:[acyl-carrier-protein] S-malonyltransferase